MKRVLVTGPTGFIGSHILRKLQAEKCELHAVNRAGRGDGESVYWHAADLRNPLEAQALVAAVRPTHLLHGAWIATPRIYGHSPENGNWLQASLALAWAFGEHGGRHFVGIGSSAEYAASSRPCIEDETPIQPATIYGKCKAACWLGIQAAAQCHGFEAAWGRVFLPYGPGDPIQRLVPAVVAAIKAGKPVEMTHGGQLRDFIYAPDAADLLVRLLLSSCTGAFNIGTGHGSSIRSIVEHIADRHRGRDLLRFGAIEPPVGEPPTLVADPNKVRSELAWSAPTSIKAGLDKMLDAKNEQREGRREPSA